MHERKLVSMFYLIFFQFSNTHAIQHVQYTNVCIILAYKIKQTFHLLTKNIKSNLHNSNLITEYKYRTLHNKSLLYNKPKFPILSNFQSIALFLSPHQLCAFCVWFDLLPFDQYLTLYYLVLHVFIRAEFVLFSGNDWLLRLTNGSLTGLTYLLKVPLNSLRNCEPFFAYS